MLNFLVAITAAHVATAAAPPASPDRSTARLGLGMALELDQSVSLLGGLDVSGTAPTPTPGVRVGIDFEQRIWWEPDAADLGIGVTNSIFSGWAGYHRLHGFARGVLGGEGLGPGASLGLSVVRDNALVVWEHGGSSYWSRVSAGPEVQVGLFDPCDWPHVVMVGRYHHPMYFHEPIFGDWVEAVDPSAQVGLGGRYRVGVVYFDLELTRRLSHLGGEMAGSWVLDVASGLGF